MRNNKNLRGSESFHGEIGILLACKLKLVALYTTKPATRAGCAVYGGEIGITQCYRLSCTGAHSLCSPAFFRPPFACSRTLFSRVRIPTFLNIYHKTRPKGGLCGIWRRDRDSNPRCSVKSTIDFESTAFDHSAISPLSYRSCSFLIVLF